MAVSVAAPAATARRVSWLMLLRVAMVVFGANAAILVLQLLASRMLAPFVGSSLETWTAIIGFYLLGISLGNAYGGQVADSSPTYGMLQRLLLVGAVATIATVAVSESLGDG